MTLKEIDSAVIGSLRRSLGDERVSTVLTSMCKDLTEQTAGLAAALKANDAKRLRLHAHSLRSTALTTGGGALARVCGGLEKLALTGTVAGAEPGVNEVQSRSARVLIELEQLLAKISAKGV